MAQQEESPDTLLIQGLFEIQISPQQFMELYQTGTLVLTSQNLIFTRTTRQIEHTLEGKVVAVDVLSSTTLRTFR